MLCEVHKMGRWFEVYRPCCLQSNPTYSKALDQTNSNELVITTLLNVLDNLIETSEAHLALWTDTIT